MGDRKKKNKHRRRRYVLPMLRLELKCYVRPILITSVVFLFALSLTAAAVLWFDRLLGAAYVFLYLSMIAHETVTVLVPLLRTIRDIKETPLFSSDDRIPKSPRPYASDLALARIISGLLFSLFAVVLHGAADAFITVLGSHCYDGYTPTLIATSVALFALLFYFTAVAVAASADYSGKAKSPRRRVAFSGVLLYTLGLMILTVTVICLSTVPLGSDAIADMAESGLNPITAVWLSLIYLAVSLLRIVYLYFIIKRRLRRALKLS